MSKNRNRETQICQKHVKIWFPGQLFYNIFTKYGPKRGAAAEGRRPLLRAAEGRDHIFIKISSKMFEPPDDICFQIFEGPPRWSILSILIAC